MTTFDIPATVAKDFRRDQWKRPYIMQSNGKRIGYTRCSSAAKTIEDTYNLELWAKRNVAYGMANDASLVARILAIGGDPSTWGQDVKKDVNGIVEDANTVAKAHKAADIGTAVHHLTHRLESGEDVHAGPYQADLDAYVKAMTAAGLTCRPEWIECRIVNDDLQMAGSCDRIVTVTIHHGRTTEAFRIADIKTGASVDFGGLGWAAQLAAYAGGLLYDIDVEERVETPPIDRNVGYIIHLPAGEGRCDIYEVDLVGGLAAAKLANEIRETRKKSKTWIRPLLWGEPKKTTSVEVADREALLARFHSFNDAEQAQFRALCIDKSDLDAVEALLDEVDGFNKPAEVPPRKTRPTPVAAPRPTPPDEGAEVSDTDVAALEVAFRALPDTAKAWVGALVAQGDEQPYPWRLRKGITTASVRKYELYRGVLALATDYANVDVLEALVYAASGDSDAVLFANVTPGVALGSFDAAQAAEFAQLAGDLIAGRQQTIADEATGRLRLLPVA